MDIKDIQNLIKFVSKAEVSEVKYKTKDFEITIKTPLAGSDAVYAQPAVYHTAPQAAAAPAPVATPAAAPSEKAEAASDDSKYVTIKSPMIGTFYRKPSPDKDVFVNVGDEVSAGKVVCVIEAMKLFNQIDSEISGKIVKILVDDATPVEYDQPLFLVDPS
ncbi:MULTISPECIES: acetyl-CoA carboxylase biotin carboxyl carrier protein [Chryseobacterium]|jgi:acetyl-CoA carboxylase biotin carboxyl carrier protein|uniref:Biotin carboxyl carrier protein of acetyl-CoA carboxylase n=1 Tax=Chryseobacterium rhizosphaerae TaxID=395937 RepID=A0AAE4C5U3_9FLAO|nr:MULTISPECIES: acetyl-CoA carboxylase biotin carboxyl carrier protein [Chryseobacterium]MBL3548723.1 acetyl-CoA carboxylase biotin carboxyl carrier protein [Chryseobacterium sp. KMC2]MDC8098330.1 acetyl-CoA carboxylase biotin carboxyl carrier protein [Chryseobacterium rhizosphaerae]MDR6529024.1 acetyl-CoA carboxylase biotin carboxyl carrier protein [Chryseobacterium rhizosphaerae]MDR6546850.1 acetyl-CoA carboxylase biotin carboxyl carrier protein [Chryseobacterium rhizosphaerae]REC78786.1 ac